MIYTISAKKRVGKDTAAKFITEARADIKSYALAQPIKEALYFGFIIMNAARPIHLWNDTIQIEAWTGDGTGIDREASLGITHEQGIEVLYNAWNRIVDIKPEFSNLTASVYLILDEIIKVPVDWSIRRLMQVFGTDIGVRVDEKIWLKFMFSVYFDAICDNMSLLITDCRQEHELDFLRKLGAKVMFITRDLGEENKDEHITEKGLTPEPTDVIIENNGTLAELKHKVLTTIGI
ncbi:MAG: hypothetical protein ACRC9Y_13435 [Aeromonas veronii]